MSRKNTGVLPALLTAAIAFLAGCGGREEVPADRLFSLLPPAHTGIDFENRVTPTEAFNVFTYRNFYNGGGVGVGDFDGDGLADVYLTANQGPNRLYLNRGGLRFEEVTEQAGVAGKGEWSTGVTVVDFNGDGLLDLYVCNAGQGEPAERANELFLNQGPGADGVPRFEEAAREHGVADEGWSIHAAFLDYDRDGDLDLYVLNNSPRPVSSFRLENTRHERHPYGGHRLYRNDPGAGAGSRRFTDVSEQAGIFGSEAAFGLAVTAGDVNRDGWTDLYVSNDFFERDYLYLNQQDGTFRDAVEEQMRYISLSSMGADLADVNNDGYPDLFVTDMLPEDDARLKQTSSFEDWDAYHANLRNGYYHQVMRNMLHLNNGDGTWTEVGQFAGVSATDWSWAALIADLDNDGFKDLFVTNGVYKDVTDNDFIDFFAAELNKVSTGRSEKLDFLEIEERIPSTPIPNYAFANNGDLTFANKTGDWGLDQPGFSNGAAYADFDNDGDLDLLVNNVNRKLFFYRNNADTLLDHRFLRVKLEGKGANRLGVGAHVAVSAGGSTFHQEQMPTRGFQSSVDPVLLFGLGRSERVDSVTVTWPDGRRQTLLDLSPNQTLTLKQQDALLRPPAPAPAPPPLLFTEADSAVGFPFRHIENSFVDFDRERLLPRMLSTEGPRLAVADVNGDGLEDVYVGGAKEQPGALLLQRPGGRFAPASAEAFAPDAASEDVAAVFFDADGDGDRDLYVVSGGNEYSEQSPALQDRLYLNQGGGRFAKSRDRLPVETVSGSAVTAFDYDRDGDVDLFVGGRSVPWQYGVSARSMLLRNDGTGRFQDVADEVAPGLAKIGMVTDAVWADADGDKLADLVLVGDWMPVTVYRNTGHGTLEPAEASELEKSHGWWNRLVAEDFDGDGDVDFVAGNVGLNMKIRADAHRPATMHVADFDGNGYFEQIVSYYKGAKSYPMILLDEMLRQVPALRKKYLQHASYTEQSVSDVFPAEQLGKAVVREAYTFTSAYVENLGGGRFALRPLPAPAQFAPVYGLLPADFDGDGHKDLLLGGNFYGVKPEIGRMDASYGLLLKGDGKGGFLPVPPKESGFRVEGQVRDLAFIPSRSGGGTLLVARNDDRVLTFRVR